MTFELRKIHIHHKSEHTVSSGTKRDFEIHLVHLPNGTTTPKLVVGILFHESRNASTTNGLAQLDEALKRRLASGWPLRAWHTDEEKETTDINPLDFFPQHQNEVDLVNWYHYEGSLTTDPYSEDVSWFVMANESAVHPDNTTALKQYAEHTPREVQPMNRRLLLRSFQ